MITSERVRELFLYDPETGLFTRRVTTSSRAKAGMVIGNKANHIKGYVQISVDGVPVLAHRLAMLYMTGSMPNEETDHINGNRTDNRWSNLRAVSTAINSQNKRSAQRNSRSGVLGVWKTKSGWASQITVLGKRKVLPMSATMDEAKEKYLTAKRAMHEGCTL